MGHCASLPFIYGYALTYHPCMGFIVQFLVEPSTDIVMTILKTKTKVELVVIYLLFFVLILGK